MAPVIPCPGDLVTSARSAPPSRRAPRSLNSYRLHWLVQRVPTRKRALVAYKCQGGGMLEGEVLQDFGDRQGFGWPIQNPGPQSSVLGGLGHPVRWPGAVGRAIANWLRLSLHSSLRLYSSVRSLLAPLLGADAVRSLSTRRV